MKKFITRSEGIFQYLAQDVLPLPLELIPSVEWLTSTSRSIASLLDEIGPFYLHFGGAGDALLLLATFLDKNPNAQIVSFPNSIPATRSFFEAFPSLKQVWFLPPNERPEIHLMLRMLMQHVPNCRGMGVTPEIDYFKEWNAGLDIFKKYGVTSRPEWTKRFRTNPRPRDVTIAPKGSLKGMLGSKRNIIDPAVWPELIRFVQQSGYTPVILGTPEERECYPCPEGCEDRRSYSFREQMEHIANSAVLIAADSWAKTFSALAGIPTLVFEPVKGTDWTGRKDVSDFIFIDPWKAITMVKNLHHCREVFARVSGHASDVAIPSKEVVVSWEGSFLDHGSLSHVNRALTGALKALPQLQIHCVTTGQPAPGLEAWTAQVSAAGPVTADVTVRHAWPPNWNRPAHGKLVVIQPWEFGALPVDWVRQSQQVDEFWLPSEYVRQVYVASGIPAEKIFVVPNGIHPEKFNPQATPMPLATSKKFKFLFVGGTIGRKGPDLLLQAYLKTFTAGDDVCLVIKDFGGKSVYAGQTFESQIRAAQALRGAPEILYLKHELPPDALPGLYTACDCLVLPYRGEGFGLPVLEAMACGRPVIVTGGGATDDFVRDEFAWRIPAEKKYFGNEISGLKLCQPGWILEPDAAALGGQMRHAFEHPDVARERGELAARHARQFYSWEKAATLAASRLAVLATLPPAIADVLPVYTPASHLPVTAHIGQIDDARQLFREKKWRLAWEAGVAAIAWRPFHPEAWLLLAEIALAAGHGVAARQCAQHARTQAPAWKPARQFLNQPLKGSNKADWLKLPTDNQIRLTICLVVKNEEKFLSQCLKSIQGLAQQIVVLDTGSTDRTVEIAKEFGAEIHSFTWCDDFSAARNAALEHARGEWILVLDADEELPPDQHALLARDLAKPEVLAYRLPLVNHGHETEGQCFVPRLFRNVPGIFYTGRVHEQIFPRLVPCARAWDMTLDFGGARLVHHGYTRELIRDRNKVERNLKLLRLAVKEEPADANLMMNFGLELIRSGDFAQGVEKYHAAFHLLSTQKEEAPPELREVFLTQFTSHLYQAKSYEEVVRVLQSPLAKAKSLTASLHFALGLALFELKQFAGAAEQMRLCINKRGQPVLSPINTDIMTAAPEHCLALSLAKAGDPAGAGKAFQSALAGKGRTPVVKLDYAKFLATQKRAVEAFHQLHELVASDSRNVAAWRAGAEIALSQPEFLEFARDWTREAVSYAAEDFTVCQQRAEVLLLSGETKPAAELWERLWKSERQPAILAALILCEALESKPVHAPDSAASEPATSRAFIKWYQKLIAMRSHEVVRQINGRLEMLAGPLPTAAAMLEKALAAPQQCAT